MYISFLVLTRLFPTLIVHVGKVAEPEEVAIDEGKVAEDSENRISVAEMIGRRCLCEIPTTFAESSLEL